MRNPPPTLFPDGATGTDVGYRNIAAASQPITEEAKQHIDELWQQYGPYADSQFPEAIRDRLDERYWEMYLGVSLLDRGLSIASEDEGPDFLIETPNGRVWIEAVSPSSGADENPDAVPPIEYGLPVASQVPIDQIVLRIRSALHNIFNQRQCFIDRGIVGESDMYVIAVNTRQIRSALSDTSPPYVLRAVYPLGNPTVTFTRDSDDVEHGYEYSPSVQRASGVEIRTDVFTTDEYSGISAVLHSHVDPCNRPPALGADFKLVHNLRARNGIPAGFIPAAKEWVPEVTLRNIHEESSRESS